MLKILHANFPQNSEASMALDRAQCRFHEQETGVYNFKQLQVRAKKLRPPHLDHATYIGPVEIKQTGSKGRGLFTTEPVKAGDLLLCEKAFSVAYVDENRGNKSISRISLLLNPETERGFVGAQTDLVRLIV